MPLLPHTTAKSPANTMLRLTQQTATSGLSQNPLGCGHPPSQRHQRGAFRDASVAIVIGRETGPTRTAPASIKPGCTAAQGCLHRPAYRSDDSNGRAAVVVARAAPGLRRDRLPNHSRGPVCHLADCPAPPAGHKTSQKTAAAAAACAAGQRPSGFYEKPASGRKNRCFRRQQHLSLWP